MVELLVLSDDIQAFVILHPPGTPNDTHYHEHDEWWVVMRGEINWHIEGEAEPIRARAGDFVLCPKLSQPPPGARRHRDDGPHRDQHPRRVPPLRPPGLPPGALADGPAT